MSVNWSARSTEQSRKIDIFLEVNSVKTKGLDISLDIMRFGISIDIKHPGIHFEINFYVISLEKKSLEISLDIIINGYIDQISSLNSLFLFISQLVSMCYLYQGTLINNNGE